MAGQEVLVKEKDEKFKVLLKSLAAAESVMEVLLKEKDERLAAAERAKEVLLKEKDERLKEKDVRILDLDAQLVEVKARHGVVSGNRPLVEIGLARLYPRLPTLSERWEKFSSDHIFTDNAKNRLCQGTIDWLADLGYSQIQDGVKKELRDFVHELSKSHHRIEGIRGEGVVCGGEQPLGCAVCLVVLQLQKEQVIDMDVRFIDEKMKDVKLLRHGNVLNPVSFT